MVLHVRIFAFHCHHDVLVKTGRSPSDIISHKFHSSVVRIKIETKEGQKNVFPAMLRIKIFSSFEISYAAVIKFEKNSNAIKLLIFTSFLGERDAGRYSPNR